MLKQTHKIDQGKNHILQIGGPGSGRLSQVGQLTPLHYFYPSSDENPLKSAIIPLCLRNQGPSLQSNILTTCLPTRNGFFRLATLTSCPLSLAFPFYTVSQNYLTWRYRKICLKSLVILSCCASMKSTNLNREYLYIPADLLSLICFKPPLKSFWMGLTC